MLMIKVHDGDARAAADAHTKRRSMEEAAESIPGFVRGDTTLSTDQPGLFCVTCGWENKAAYQAWQNSPLLASDASPGVDEKGELLPWEADVKRYAGHPRTASAYAMTLQLGREQGVPLMFTLAQLS